MQYLGVEYSVKHMPELDPDFIPFGVWLEAYAKGAEKPLTIALERDQGKISVRETKIHGTPEMAEADYRYVERYVKFLLWSIGGFRIWICGDSALAQRLQRRDIRVHPRRPENDIRRQAVEIPGACPQDCAPVCKLPDLLRQVLQRRFVTAGDGAAIVQQQLHQRQIADAQAQHNDALALQRRKILTNCHPRSFPSAGRASAPAI